MESAQYQKLKFHSALDPFPELPQLHQISHRIFFSLRNGKYLIKTLENIYTS